MIKRTLPLIVLVLSFLFVFAYPKFNSSNHKYIGIKSCSCHNMATKGKIIDIWKKTKHALAYKTLTTNEADKIVKGKGYDKPATETAECLICHVTGYGKETAGKYSKEEGVTCESCHGPASEWKSLHVRKDRLADAIQAGFIIDRINKKNPSKVEEQCKTCHNKKSPTFKEFKFASEWSKIIHNTP